MNNYFKVTSSKIEKSDILNKIKNYNNEIIDLSDLNFFEATKTIILISTYGMNKNFKKKFRYKVSTPNIQAILSDNPISNMIELV